MAVSRWFGWAMNASPLVVLFYGMLRLARWQLALVLVGASLLLHYVTAYYVTPAVHHTELGALLQALILFWGGWTYLCSALLTEIGNVEKRQDRVATAIDGVVELARLLPRYGVGYDGFKAEWNAVLDDSTVHKLRRREHLSEHLEEELHRACFPRGVTAEQSINSDLHILVMQLLDRLREFRAQVFLDLEATNIVRLVLVCTVAAGLSTFLNALEILHRRDGEPIDPTGPEYWVLATTLAVFSGWGSSLVVHGNFSLGFNRQRFATQSRRGFGEGGAATKQTNSYYPSTNRWSHPPAVLTTSFE